ncbi:MAG: phosphatase PAP2 family protein [Rhodospirillales bacterium]|nr:phosphatase PAP2 family protein [Rhodospirillales bacterium]
MIRRLAFFSVLLASAAQAGEPAYRWGGGLDTPHPVFVESSWAESSWAESSWAEPARQLPVLLAAALDATPGAVPPAPEPTPAPRGEPLLNDDYWLNYFNNIPRLFTAPTRFDTTDWIKTGAFVIAAGGAYLGDEHIRRFFRDHRTSTGDSIAAAGYRLGDGKTILGGVAVAYAAGYATEDVKLRNTALLTLQAWALTGGITEATKHLAGRQRPGYTDDKTQFDGWGGAGKSFFSGHAANAFTVAAVVSEQYDDIWVAPVAYGLAGLVAWSRLNDNAHWASDVVVGAGVGYAVGKLVAHFSPFRDDLGVTATPMLAPGGGGVQLGFRF